MVISEKQNDKVVLKLSMAILLAVTEDSLEINAMQIYYSIIIYTASRGI